MATLKNLNLHPTAIYWLPGETPGKLARSKLRGLHIIILATRRLKPHIVFTQAINHAIKLGIKLGYEIENQAHQHLIKHLNTI